MPMYQYVCRECEQAFEKRLRMSQSGETQSCPTCGSMDTRKRIGAVASVGGATRSAPRISAPPPSSPFT